MTINEALATGQKELYQLANPALDARLLLEHVLQASHSYLIAHHDDRLSPDQEQSYRSLLSRAAQREPIPYIVGHAPFYELDFTVTPAVLIPRPETELLVNEALTWAKGHESLHVVDVGTGSGCIAITLARYLPEAYIDATDISRAALAVAIENATRHVGAHRIHFHLGPLLAPVEEPADLIVANLPYISDHEWTMLDDGVKWYEPSSALKGGPKGLTLIAQMLDQARLHLFTGGAIFFEIGWQQGPAAQRLAQHYFPHARVSVRTDLSGHDRIVFVQT